uniref:Protein-tyrosine-phosphatase n=1 Tax=Caenorhabditis japonica TaxID=281687 RepID=A0A8R1EII0_CAEJA
MRHLSGGQSAVFRQLTGRDWPDRGVPDEKCHTVPQNLLARVRHGPCVVHCSAGIGRTGCVVALEFAYRKLHRGMKVDFEEITQELRNQRAQCIQTEIQYLYIHRVMIAFARGENGISEKAQTAADAFLKSYDCHLRLKC